VEAQVVQVQRLLLLVQLVNMAVEAAVVEVLPTQLVVLVVMV
jgi:hypothetical protein